MYPVETKGLRRSLESRLSNRVQRVPPSPIRRYFDLTTTMDDVISLGIGEPDYVTPKSVLNAGTDSLLQGNTAYTSNAGMLELREAVANMLTERYGAPAYDAATEAAHHCRRKRGNVLGDAGVARPGRRSARPATLLCILYCRCDFLPAARLSTSPLMRTIILS